MNFLISIINHRRIIANLIKSDFRNRYLGNHLGIVWAFIQPLVMIAVYWAVFTYGLRAARVDNAPFILWLLAGMVPWFFINDAITSAGRAILDQSFLVKKIVFEIKLLPIIKLGSALLVNMAFWGFLIIFLVIYGYYPNLMWLQIIYFMLCSIAFTLSVSILISSIMVFMQDIAQVVSIVMQIMFWVTPVMWDKNMVPERYIWIIKLNPFAYIVDGVRDALIYKLPFWVHYNMTIYFWVITIVIFLVGNKIFNNLRPHFADVL